MSAPLSRETATDRADLPHPFTPMASSCEICGGTTMDERHVSWSDQQDAGRENAAVTLKREFGT